MLACGAIANAQQLLLSNAGNDHDQVGRYFMCHPLSQNGVISAYGYLTAGETRLMNGQKQVGARGLQELLDGLPGVAGIGDKKAADLVRRYGSIEAMLEAGIFRSADAEYLEKAQRVVPPVSDLKIKVPRGRRSRYPEQPEIVTEIGRRFGVTNSLERLVTALKSMP